MDNALILITLIALVAALTFAALYMRTRLNEKRVRQDAIDRSRSVIIGKVTEHLTPWLPDFPYNPKDARFLGSPVDMIIFDGCDEDNLQEIVFLEIKTNSSTLSARQRQIRDAVRAGKVVWRELRIGTPEATEAESSRRSW